MVLPLFVFQGKEQHIVDPQVPFEAFVRLLIVVLASVPWYSYPRTLVPLYPYPEVQYRGTLLR